MRSGRALLGAALAALALCGCESNIQRSAQLERTRLSHVRALKTSTVSIAKPNPKVQVLESAVIESRSGDAVAVVLRNRSDEALGDLPIQIKVEGQAGQVLYRNDEAGVSGSLITVPLLAPHATATWIDDQVSAGGRPERVEVLVGAGRQAPTSTPRLRVQGAQQPAGGEEVRGTVRNGSAIAQHELVVDAVARRAGRVVAAGRAVLPEAAAGSSSPFTLYLVGKPKGASLQLSAHASTLR